MPTSSDPYDDDDFFSDPKALEALAAVEERAIAAASQAPKPKQNHYTLARPGAGPRAAPAPAPNLRKAPPPLNTNPRVSGCGFGWEPGGKHAVRLAQGMSINGMSRFNTDEEEPRDVLVDNDGRYGFGATPAAAAENAPGAKGQHQRSRSGTPLPGSQARREAIAAALPPRAPMQRSTSTNAVAGPSTGGFPSRPFGRSVSTGSQVFGQRAVSGAPSRGANVLPPISSQGAQPSSQGTAARRAVFALEEERRLREASEAEVRALRERLESAERSRGSGTPPWRDDAEGNNDAELARLKQQLYAAQGQASTAKRNQETMEARMHGEMEKLRATIRDMDNQMRVREHESKQKIESMKTQAVFSNHNALASASKARQQSQWHASQRGATPMKSGSPLKDRSMVTPARLMRSAAKGKGVPAPPRFDGLTNAFNITPVVARRRRQSEALSPETTPKKLKKQRQMSSSPTTSPAHSQPGRPVTPLDAEDVSMDWQPDFSEPALELAAASEDDPKTELRYHLLNHVAASPLHVATGNWAELTIFRLVSYHLDGPPEAMLRWRAGLSALQAVCGSTATPYTELCQHLIAAFADLFVGLAETRRGLEEAGKPVLLADADIDVLRLFASTVLLFPAVLAADPVSASEIVVSLNLLSRSLNANSKQSVVPAWAERNITTTVDENSMLPEALAERDRPQAVVEGELGDAIAEAAEAICMADGRTLWRSDELSSIILNLTMADDANIAYRGFQVFVTAACRREHARALLTAPDALSGGITLMDRVARFLINGHPKLGTAQRFEITRGLLGALSMLSRNLEDAVVLMTEGASILVSALIVHLHREAAKLWGIRSKPVGQHNPMALVTPTVALLHSFVFPAPHLKPGATQSGAGGAEGVDAMLFGPERPQGTMLDKLQDSASMKEFNGIQNTLVSALAPIAYAEVDENNSAWAFSLRPPGVESDEGNPSELRMVQFLAQDLLNSFVYGSEADSVYYLYMSDGDDGAGSEAVPDAEPEVIEVQDDDEDYDEEQALMEGNWNEGEYDV